MKSRKGGKGEGKNRKLEGKERDEIPRARRRKEKIKKTRKAISEEGKGKV